jgi:hypothetical protein
MPGKGLAYIFCALSIIPIEFGCKRYAPGALDGMGRHVSKSYTQLRVGGIRSGVDCVAAGDGST